MIDVIKCVIKSQLYWNNHKTRKENEYIQIVNSWLDTKQMLYPYSVGIHQQPTNCIVSPESHTTSISPSLNNVITFVFCESYYWIPFFTHSDKSEKYRYKKINWHLVNHQVVVVFVVFTPDHGSKPHWIYQSTIQPLHRSCAGCQAIYQY
jgi:hypothetical protein